MSFLNLDTLASTLSQPVILDPLEQGSWDCLLDAHADAFIFHGSAWARVLRQSYGHQPCFCARLRDGKLDAVLPLMEVSSPWTGRRGVSLPFTDFCPVLDATGQGGRGLFELAMERGRQRGWRYLELRAPACALPPGSPVPWPGATPSLTFHGHVIDLSGGPDALLKACAPAIRRGVRKGDAAKLDIEFSASSEAMRAFVDLHWQTRRRHGVPPQPTRFFDQIASQVLASGQGLVAIARVAGRPVAAAVFFHRRPHALYKFGASDYSFQHLRPNNLLMWEAMKHYAADGYASLHMGRTSLAGEGLRRFKLGFGAIEQKIEYYRYDFRKQAFVTSVDRAEGWFNRVFRCLPPPLFRLAGALLYPHLS
jgi:CelD/BcsL family acetyltransferase involved in cellulose biosynthesis